MTFQSNPPISNRQLERDRIIEILHRPKSQRLAELTGFTLKGISFRGDCPIHFNCKASFFVATRGDIAHKRILFGCNKKTASKVLVAGFWTRKQINVSHDLLTIEPDKRLPHGTVTALLSRYTRKPNPSERKSLKRRTASLRIPWKSVTQGMRRKWGSSSTHTLQASLDKMVIPETLGAQEDKGRNEASENGFKWPHTASIQGESAILKPFEVSAQFPHRGFPHSFRTVSAHQEGGFMATKAKGGRPHLEASPETESKVKLLREHGASTRAIARQTGLSHWRVRQILKPPPTPLEVEEEPKLAKKPVSPELKEARKLVQGWLDPSSPECYRDKTLFGETLKKNLETFKLAASSNGQEDPEYSWTAEARERALAAGDGQSNEPIDRLMGIASKDMSLGKVVQEVQEIESVIEMQGLSWPRRGRKSQDTERVNPLRDKQSLRRFAKKIQDGLTEGQHWITEETALGIERGDPSSTMKLDAHKHGRILGREEGWRDGSSIEEQTPLRLPQQVAA